MSLDLKKMMQEASQRFGTKFEELPSGAYLIDVPLKLKDGSIRYQYVYGSVGLDPTQNKEFFYLNSRCGIINEQTDFAGILRDARYGIYTTIAIVNDRQRDGTPCETLIVQASPLVEYTAQEQLLYIITEIAEKADIIEEKYFGGDMH
ncbi:MAG: hypothetical protein EAZ55_14520 [Cytophagales bacterium]|nr:MAG: hypothetical protein EAZ55_14520 [Cytophagales bacterium]